MNYKKAIEILTSKENFHINLGLERIKNVLMLFDNPQDALRCIHVAGTNGKGSVCVILDSILTEAGYKTGLYTSPHIWNYTERIKINGREIEENEFADLVKEVTSSGIYLTEFEILTVVMFLYFKRNNVDVVILETGLGGRFDATNVIKENLCAIITQIDLDHTDRLGKTKDEIAYEKAGIIKKGCPVVTAMGYEAIKDKADEMDSMFIMSTPFVEPQFAEALTLKGFHQIENLSLALNAINYLFKEISSEIIIKGLKSVNHPCRFEFIEEKNIIIDASHNPNGVQALRNNLDYYYPNQKRRFVFGALQTKNYEQMMNILFEEGDEVYLYGFDYPNACSFEQLQEKCSVNANQYYSETIFKPDKLNVVCGSFYMIEKFSFLKNIK